ncbi:hypothetical protein Kpol_1026p1, partial [Vanderwaltozyma polyspora DSM 70294]
LLWAPYRSNCYFGIRPRNINNSPLIMGVMWYDNSRKDGMVNIRHFVDQNDKMSKYSWEIYDPRIGGKEVIIDETNNMNVTFTFVKSRNGENWAVRVNGKPIDASRPSTASMIIYFSQNGEEDGSKLVKIANDDSNNISFNGLSKELGSYKLSFNDNYGTYFVDPSLPSMEVAPGSDSSRTSHVSLRVPDKETWKAKDIYQTLLTESINDLVGKDQADFHPSLIPSILTIRNVHNFPPGNLHYIQKTYDNSNEEGFEFDITFNKRKTTQRIRSRKDISGLISRAVNEIQSKFDRIFKIKEESAQYRPFALETLSNLLGGIGYFHGSQIVDRITELDDETFDKPNFKNRKEEDPIDLFTSVPSRAFFPRGFYWDEGFHLLQIMEYDFDLAFEIITSWFNNIENETGWIAREVILGEEARVRVPEEFTVQSPKIANPPTLLLTFSEMLNRAIEYQNQITYGGNNMNLNSRSMESTSELEKNSELLVKYAKKIYPKLLQHYHWFRESQRGVIEEYEEIFEDLGISDKVHTEELYKWSGRTVDHCLPSGLDDYPRAQPPDISELNVDALAWVGVMTRSMKRIAQVLNLEKDENLYEQIEREIVENLDLIHWSEEKNCYCDVVVDEFDDDLQSVCHEGYISILPFALKLIPEDSPKLDKIVDLMQDKNKLFSDFGLRSLSKEDENFGKGENYWRGKIWMNINYLCLDALKYYYPAIETGVNKSESKKAVSLYNNLRTNLIKNVYKVWEEQGFCYENYDPVDGHGTGAEQFTGWTALIVNIMGLF